MYFDGAEWRFQDDDSVVSDGWQDRPCAHCGEHATTEGHDHCIASLPDVANACCGHGVTDEAYIQFADGRRLGGQLAHDYIAAIRARGADTEKGKSDAG